MSLFSSTAETSRTSAKMYVAIGDLPAFLDPGQPPLKKNPWLHINQTPFVQKATMTLPEEFYQSVWDKIPMRFKEAKYVKVIMKLQDVLEGEFLDRYVKKGNVLMLSEGQPGVDNVFSLREGVLRLDLDKTTYEQAGLQGQPIPSGGRQHVPSRYRVELDLRKPSMVHGRSGFERIKWAAKNVLDQSLLWLLQDPDQEQTGQYFRSLYNLATETEPDPAPTELIQHHPTRTAAVAQVQQRTKIPIPSSISSPLPKKPHPETEEDYFDLVEWLDLLALGSPRVTSTDSIDPYLCRYSPPPSDPTSSPVDLVVIQWTGLLTSKWVTELLVLIIKHSRTTQSPQWFAFSAASHKTDSLSQHDGYTILLHPWSSGGGQEKNHLMEKVPEENSENPKNRGGLQKFTSFAFVDSER